jgi:AcrR family transcriptional regulator
MTEQLVNRKMPRTKEQLEKIREEARKKIINAAIKLFSNKGYHGTSISDIAKEAEISKGLAYNYFDSKQDILKAIFEMMMQMGFEIVGDLEKVKDPFDQIEFIISNSCNYVKENVVIWRLYLGMAFQPEVMDSATNNTIDFTKAMIKLIEKVFRKAGFKNVRTEAQIFAATLDGVMLYYIFDPDNFPLDKVKNTLVKRYSREQISQFI